MPRETKAERELREAKELKAQERAKKAAEKKALKVQEKSEPNVVIVDFSESTKNILKDLVEAFMIASKSNSSKFQSGSPKSESVKKEDASIGIPYPDKVVSNNSNSPVVATISLTKIRELINEKAGEQKTTQIVDLLSKFGATSASTLSDEHYDNFFEALQKL